jgi:hypothetical protein
MFNSSKTLIESICCFVIVAMLQNTANAQVVINEFTAANYNQFGFQGNGEFEDWVELYNSSANTVDISGFWLSDDTTNPQKWAFPSGTLIGPNEFLVVVLSALGDSSPFEYGMHNASFKLKQTEGEQIVFSSPDLLDIEYYDFSILGTNQMNHSFARENDGGQNWKISTTPTMSAPNSGPFGNEYAAKPQTDMSAGFYDSPVDVVLAIGNPEDLIYFTLDGSEPNAESSLYASAIQISESSVLRAIAFSSLPDVLPSFITTNTYLIGEEAHSIPVVCLTGGGLESGIWNSGNHESVLEIFDDDGGFITKAHGSGNESGSDSNAFNQRGFDFIVEDEMGYDHHVVHDLFSNTDRTDYQRLIFKAGGTDNYPQGLPFGTHIKGVLAHQLCIKSGLDIDARNDAFCAVYLNGQYHGLYTMREKVDDLDFFEYHHNQSKGKVDYIKLWGGQWSEYGSSDGWDEILDYSYENSICDGDNYQWMKDRVEITSFTDYFILQSFLLNHYGISWDVSWWRGNQPEDGSVKWRHALWDMDHTFWGTTYTGGFGTESTSLPCVFLENGTGDLVTLAEALFEVPEFRDQYVARYNELATSYFSCEYMNSLIDSIETTILPEMPRHIDKWGGSMEEWQGNIQMIRDMVGERCDNVILSLVDECWPVEEIDEFTTFITFNENATLLINGESISGENSPYELLTPACAGWVILEALDGPSNFIGWEVTSGSLIIDDPSNSYLSYNIESDIEITALYDFVDQIPKTTKPTFNIFPNPANKEVQITTNVSIEKIDLLDSGGRIILSWDKAQSRNKLNVSNIGAGIYTIVIHHPQGQLSTLLSIME